MHNLSVRYDENLPLTLAMDGSPVGIGAVLSHIMSDGTEKLIRFVHDSYRQWT